MPSQSLVHRAVSAGVLAALAVGVGCAPEKVANPPTYQHPAQVIDAAAPPGAYVPVERVTADTLAASAVNEPPGTGGKKLNILAVSGGGQYGSYAAGLLVGWSCRGDRPCFDVVTGISSGALIAALVYAGPKYDPLLTQLFTTLRTEDLFRYRPVAVHLIRDNALADSSPLKRKLDETISEEFLADMRAAHAAGRRLFVGTMNVMTRRATIWDLGAIACSGRPDAGEQVRKVLLAAASISGMAAPIEFGVNVNGACYTEYHADGGGVIQSFVRFGPEAPRPDPANPSAPWLAGSNLYVIGGGKLYKEVLEEKPGFIGRILSNVSATLYALFRADAWKMYTLCVASGMRFHMTAVPAEAYTGERSTEFSPEVQQQLYTIGYDLITKGNPWRTTPPGYEPDEWDLPRAGLTFTVPPPGLAVPAWVATGPPPAAPPAPAAGSPPAPEYTPVRPVVRLRHQPLIEIPKL